MQMCHPAEFIRVFVRYSESHLRKVLILKAETHSLRSAHFNDPFGALLSFPTSSSSGGLSVRFLVWTTSCPGLIVFSDREVLQKIAIVLPIRFPG